MVDGTSDKQGGLIKSQAKFRLKCACGTLPTRKASATKPPLSTQAAIRLLVLASVLIVLSLAFVARAAKPMNSSLATVFVTASNFVFTPDQVTIDVGDTVQWDNTGGFHSVVADDGSFTSGAPSSSPWTYNFTLNTPGTYSYYCEVHGAPGGVGMSGVITVEISNPVYLPLVLHNP